MTRKLIAAGHVPRWNCRNCARGAFAATLQLFVELCAAVAADAAAAAAAAVVVVVVVVVVFVVVVVVDDSIVQVQPSMARELFAAGFVSCWAELEEPMREALVRSLEAALASPSIPPEIVTTLLNLAEFMEHNEKKLPLDTRQAALLSGTPVTHPSTSYKYKTSS